MKKLIFTALATFTMSILFAQKMEYSISINSGLFSFAGKSAEKVSFINYAGNMGFGYTNNPYGAKPGLCYGLSGNVKRVAKGNFIFGADLGYELLRSKVAIDGVNDLALFSTNEMKATGKTNLNFSFINLEPFAGYRFKAHSFNIDLTGGIDLGYCLSAKEKGKATTMDGTVYKTSEDRKTIKMELRPRLQAGMQYKKVGAYAGYSFGRANYMSGYVGGTNECYARLLRFGITYIIK